MPFAYLKRERIVEIKKAFMGPLVSYDDEVRILLMNTIPPSYVQRLDKIPNPFNQLARDLESLNGFEKLNDGTIPLKIWLQNAKDQFKDLVEVKVFEQALEDLEAGPAQPSDTDVIIVGIEALWALIRQNPIAFNAVLIYRKIFQISQWEIDVIADYKLMHDTLHKLQLMWPDTSVVIALYSIPSPMQTFTNYAGSLNDTVDLLITTYGNGYVDGAERTWINDLANEQTNLADVLDEQKNPDDPLNEANKPNIEKAFYDIKNQLTSQLSLLNTRLKAAINKLHLTDLIEAMERVCNVLKEFAPEHASKQVAQYENSIAKLKDLDQELSKLLKQHDDWQGADTLLRTLGDTLKKSSDSSQVRNSVQEAERLSKLKFILTIIENNVAPLYKDRETFWSKTLTSSAKKFKVEVEIKKDTDKAEREFDTYRQQAWNFFVELDTEMKAQCEKLRRIGEELRKVNDELKVNDALEDM